MHPFRWSPGLGYYRDVPPEWFADGTADCDESTSSRRVAREGGWQASCQRAKHTKTKSLSAVQNVEDSTHLVRYWYHLHLWSMSPGRCQEKAEEVEQQHILWRTTWPLDFARSSPPTGVGCYPRNVKLGLLQVEVYDASFRECQRFFSLLWEKKREPLKGFLCQKSLLKKRLLRPFFCFCFSLGMFLERCSALTKIAELNLDEMNRTLVRFQLSFV